MNYILITLQLYKKSNVMKYVAKVTYEKFSFFIQNQTIVFPYPKLSISIYNPVFKSKNKNNDMTCLGDAIEKLK